MDQLHIADTRGWRKALVSRKTWRDMRDTLHELRSVQYDVSIDIQGAIKSAALGWLSQADKEYGFAQPWERAAALFYDHAVRVTGTHIVEQNISLAFAATGAASMGSLECWLPVDPVAEAWAERTLNSEGLTDFAILSPGAGWGSKCWLPEKYAELAQLLAGAGIPSLINCGPAENRLAEMVELESKGAARRISSSLPELIALTRRAVLFVGGDTGPLHLAVTLNVPSVALFGPTDPARNGPYGGRAIVLRSGESSTTYRRSLESEEGLASISPDEVFAAASKVIGRRLG